MSGGDATITNHGELKSYDISYGRSRSEKAVRALRSRVRKRLEYRTILEDVCLRMQRQFREAVKNV
jgi:hypothetical protein